MTDEAGGVIRRITVVGFGLIGGSVAMAARARAGVSHVTAVDVGDVLAEAKARRAADEIVDIADDDGCLRSMAASDLVVLAMPVRAIAQRLEKGLGDTRLATDCGSTKRVIVEAAVRSSWAPRFVAGHPMAGRPRGGLEQASPDLFVGRPWILCPDGSEPAATDRVESFVSHLGATPHRMDAAAHDRAVATTSHAPQLLASALAVLADQRRAQEAAGPAFESATRVAGGGEAMWRDILDTNADEVATVLRELVEQLDRIASELATDPPSLAATLELLERARASRRGAD